MSGSSNITLFTTLYRLIEYRHTTHDYFYHLPFHTLYPYTIVSDVYVLRASMWLHGKNQAHVASPTRWKPTQNIQWPTLSLWCEEWINISLLFSSFRRHIYSKTDWIVLEMGNSIIVIDICPPRRPHNTPITHYYYYELGSWYVPSWHRELWLWHFSMVRWATQQPNAKAKSVIICCCFFFFVWMAWVKRWTRKLWFRFSGNGRRTFVTIYYIISERIRQDTKCMRRNVM